MTDRARDGEAREAAGGGRPAEAAGRGEVRERGGPGHGGAPARVCELCGGPVLDRHCKIVCLNCGYRRDCSDP